MLKNHVSIVKLIFIHVVYFTIVAISYMLLAPFFNKIILIIILTLLFGNLALKYKSYLFRFEERKQDINVLVGLSSILIVAAGAYNYYSLDNKDTLLIFIFVFLAILLFFVYKILFNKIDSYYNQSLSKKVNINMNFIEEMNSGSDKSKRIKTKYRKYIYLFFILTISMFLFSPFAKNQDFWGIYSICTCVYAYLVYRSMINEE